MLKSAITLTLCAGAIAAAAQPKLKIDSITVTGQYAHYTPQPGDVFAVSVHDWAGSFEKKYTAPIDPSGKFTVKLPYPAAGNIFLDWGRISEVNAAIPGETIRLYADLDEYKNGKKPVSTRFEGTNANVHTNIMRYKHDVRKFNDALFPDPNGDAVTPLQLRDSVTAALQRGLRDLNDYARKHNLDKRSRQFLEADLIYEAAAAMSQYSRTFRDNLGEQFNNGYFKTLDSIKTLARSNEFVTREYLTVLRDIQSLSYTIGARHKTKNYDSITKTLFTDPFEKELVYTWKLNLDLAASKILEKQLLQAFEANVKNPFLRSEVHARNNELISLSQNDELLANTPLITTMPELATAEEMMAYVASKHKGKVIYMDIWGTWCAPCREQMQYSPALKQRLKDKDVVFVYLANGSPEQAWKNAIKQYKLTGENVFHYNLPRLQQAILDKKYIYRGYPTYILIDKEGKYVTNQAPRPNNPDAVVKAIGELL